MPGDETRPQGLNEPVAHLVDLAREELGEMSMRRRAEGFVKLSARRSPQKRRVRIALYLAAALSVAGLLVAGHRWLPVHGPAPLSFAVDAGRVDESGTVQASGDREPTLRFSDGTEVLFLSGARGRVRSVDEHGARIALEGKAKVDVVHWRDARWLFDAGPYMITVKGTSFTAEWRDADERLEVVLKNGSVAVSGPLSDEAITLRAGQRLIISSREKEVIIRDIDAADTGATPSAAAARAWEDDESAPTVTSQGPAERAPRRGAAPPASTGTPAAPQRSWTAELAAGHFATILKDAEQRGLETSLAEVSSDDLAALADAARYSRREDLARRALAAQRRRFPASARANDAAFLLGRLEETAQHPELALGWYDRCLTESPRGTYTSEALGRKMTVVQRLYGAARARPVAEEYLRRFGDGTYAAAARALTRAP